MSSHDLNGMSLADLQQLQKDVAKAIDTYRERQKTAARVELEALAREKGFKLEEIVDAAPKKRGRSIAPPKYCHPDNPDVTWTGRGRKPGWFIAALEQGKRPEDMLI